MEKLSTLTVHDMLWVHLQLTKSTGNFRFDRLEEATYLQYGHGSSSDVIGQATRLLLQFPEMRPFDKGNMAVAFAAFAAFLNMNGYELAVPADGAGDWLKRIWSEASSARQMVGDSVNEIHHHDVMGIPNRRAALIWALDKYSTTLAELLKSEPVSPLS